MKKMFSKRKMYNVIALILSLAMICGFFTGCGTPVNQKSSDGKVHITIGGMPNEKTEANAATYELFQENVKNFMQENPNIVVEADPWSFDLKNYLTKAAAGDLPTMFYTSPTELRTLVNSGYIKDVTKFAKKYGYEDGYNNEDYSDLYKVDDKYYALVKDGSISYIGIIYNINLFRQAGLLDENGIPKYPQTWEELAQTAKIIKDKTGKYGFCMPTKNNQGGWLFLNIMWAYGADFMEKKDGKWVATFASDEGAAALNYLKDLKWKYNVLQDETLADVFTEGQYLSTDNVGMTINGVGMLNNFVSKFQLDVKNMAMSRNPAGPAGRISQRNSNIYVFSGTDEENEACFKWLDFIGQGAKANDAMKENIEKNAKISAGKNYAVGYGVLSVWKDKERNKVESEILDKYATVDKKYFKDYIDGEDVIYKSEPPRCAQQLYSVLDACIQQVLNDKNADCKAILEQAQKDFQLNYLDKETN